MERNAKKFTRMLRRPTSTGQGMTASLLLVEGSGFHRRLGYLATFLLDEKFIPKEVDVSEALDASVITEALRTWKKGQ
jgi:hypothetical protein